MSTEKRFKVAVNEDRRNNHLYPWVVKDHGESSESTMGTPVAFTVTEHTAWLYARQLNEDGYISSV